MKLAKEIVGVYYGEKDAEKAEKSFVDTFQKNEIPKNIIKIEAKSGDEIINIFIQNKFLSSKTEFRRLVDEGAITNLTTNEKIKKYNEIAINSVYKIGKKRFCEIVIK